MVYDYPTFISQQDVGLLLSLSAFKLKKLLKTNWFCFTEDGGIHAMQLSRNLEKSVQRRLHFSWAGEVQLSVHCSPTSPSSFLDCDSNVRLSDMESVDLFAGWMAGVINVVRQLEVCTGVSHEKYKHLWARCSSGKVDKNPYQENRYSVTFRSRKCRMLVYPSHRKCQACSKLHDSLRVRARASAKTNIHPHATNKSLTVGQKLLKLYKKEKEVMHLRMRLQQLCFS
jgi:hypothetical protein